MTQPPIKIPGPDHPISITASGDHVVVKVAGTVVADTSAALVLQEASYPAVLYIPREDVQMSLLTRTEHHTYCPFKGDCRYYSIKSAGDQGTNAVWTYETPYEAVAAIRDYLAFYPHRVSIDVLPMSGPSSAPI